MQGYIERIYLKIPSKFEKKRKVWGYIYVVMGGLKEGKNQTFYNDCNKKTQSAKTYSSGEQRKHKIKVVNYLPMMVFLNLFNLFFFIGVDLSN